MKEVLSKKFWQDAKRTFEEAKQDPPAIAPPKSDGRAPFPDALSAVQQIQGAIGRLAPQELEELFTWLEQHYPRAIGAHTDVSP